jgi:hypothetical protein
MTNGNGNPPMLDGCAVLPPIESAESPGKTGSQPKPKRRPNQRKTASRFAVLNSFVDAAAGDLSRSEILVWLVLYRDTRNGIAQTSQADIARRAKLGDRTVRYAICRLVNRGLLNVVCRGGLNRGPSKYRVLTDLHGERLRQ